MRKKNAYTHTMKETPTRELKIDQKKTIILCATKRAKNWFSEKAVAFISID